LPAPVSPVPPEAETPPELEPPVAPAPAPLEPPPVPEFPAFPLLPLSSLLLHAMIIVANNTPKQRTEFR
jgi:hypothetical protein